MIHNHKLNINLINLINKNKIILRLKKTKKNGQIKNSHKKAKSLKLVSMKFQMTNNKRIVNSILTDRQRSIDTVRIENITERPKRRQNLISDEKINNSLIDYKKEMSRTYLNKNDLIPLQIRNSSVRKKK